MQNVAWPSAAKIVDLALNVEAHSIGGASMGGHDAHAIGPGAHWKGRANIPAMLADDALDMRGFIHSLRGQSGSFILPLPAPTLTPDPRTDTTCPRMDGKTRFADCTDFSDGTGFADDYFAPGYDPHIDGYVRFSDSTGFSDDTGFSDLYVAPTEVVGTLAAGFPQYTSQIAVDLPFAYRDALRVGMFLWIGDDYDTGQLVRVVDVGPLLVEIRPRLRSAYGDGTAVKVSAPIGKFRIDGETPIVPLNGFNSEPFEISFAEFY